MRPLDRIRSIKTKMSIVIVAAVAVTAATSTIGFRLGVPLLLGPIISASLALAMVQFLAHGMTRPLRAMANAAPSMARGDYSLRVHTTSVDEVGRLADAFNHMAAELAETDRQRRDLVANVSHELRTPSPRYRRHSRISSMESRNRTRQRFVRCTAQTERLAGCSRSTGLVATRIGRDAIVCRAHPLARC